MYALIIAGGRGERLAASAPSPVPVKPLLRDATGRRLIDRVLDACDAVTAEVTAPAEGTLGAELAGGGTVSSWAEREGVRTEEAAVATVRLLASLT